MKPSWDVWLPFQPGDIISAKNGPKVMTVLVLGPLEARGVQDAVIIASNVPVAPAGTRRNYNLTKSMAQAQEVRVTRRMA